MGKEIKIGLAVIAVLLSVFGGVLYVRLRGDTPTVEIPVKKEDSKDERASKKPKKKRAGGPDADQVAATQRKRRSSAAAKDEPRESAKLSDSLNAGGALARSVEDAASEGRDDAEDQEMMYGRYGKRYSDARENRRETDEVGLDSDNDAGEDGHNADDGKLTDSDELENMGRRALGRDAADAGMDTISDRRRRERFDLAATRERDDRYGKQARFADDIEGVSSRPPSKLELSESEAPLASDEADEGDDEPDAGSRFERRSVDDDRRVLPVSRREDAAFVPNAGSAQDDAPLEFEGESYTVRPNDNYWTISQRVYGTGAYFKALQEFNRERFPNPDRLDVDDVVTVPEVDVLEQTYPKLCPKRRHVAAQRRAATMVSSHSREAAGGRVYTVAERDTLFDIARRELGSAERWVEIHELNRGQLGDEIHYLTPGTKLVLPSDGPSVPQPAERTATRRRPGQSLR
jgi:nucleoid-associated protein YgaU